MKKILMKIFATVISTINLLCGWCYADEIDPMVPYNRATINPVDIISIIIIGIVIIAIVAIAIILLATSKKNKDEKTKNEK